MRIVQNCCTLGGNFKRKKLILGVINFGLEVSVASWLRDALHVTDFVETGTYKGQTSFRMSHVFKNVFTVEGSDFYFKLATENLKNLNNVAITKSDSVDFLNSSNWGRGPAVFWLDAHWCGTQTAGVEYECPILEEIEALKRIDLNRSAILIDDARLFLKPPPHPHKIHQWPTLREIIDRLPKEHEIFIHNDVIYSVPSFIFGSFTEFLSNEEMKIQINKTSKVVNLAKEVFRKFGFQ